MQKVDANPHHSSVIKKPRRVLLPVISKRKLEEVISKIERSRVTLATRAPKFLHPWSVVSSWLPNESTIDEGLHYASLTKEQAETTENAQSSNDWSWHLQIMPGFVNGTPVRVKAKAKNVSFSARELIKEERENDPTSIKKGLPEGDEEIDVPITAFPYLSISKEDLRIIGEGSSPTVSVDANGGIKFSSEPVPDTFKAMGVEDSKSQIKIGFGGIKISETGEQPDPLTIRYLRACDLVLKVERASLKFDIERGNPFLDGYTQLLTPRYARNAKTRRYASLFLTPGPFQPPPELEEEGPDRSGAGDPEYDYLKIATIYFISPFNSSVDADLTRFWQVEVKYDVFWNLCHMPAEIPSMLDPTPIRFAIVPLPGLAIATAMINGLLAPINDAVSRYIAFLRSKRVRGTFWST